MISMVASIVEWNGRDEKRREEEKKDCLQVLEMLRDDWQAKAG